MKKKLISLSLLILFFAGSMGTAKPSTVEVDLTWSNENLPLKMQVYSVKKDHESFISETKVVKSLQEAPVVSDLKGHVVATLNGSTTVVLVMKNDTDKDVYLFAVPHELNPHHASAGHYFECLCIGRVYKIPQKTIWYRIVRINLNSTFQAMKSFEINHKLIGLTKEQVEADYKDRLYEKE